MKLKTHNKSFHLTFFCYASKCSSTGSGRAKSLISKELFVYFGLKQCLYRPFRGQKEGKAFSFARKQNLITLILMLKSAIQGLKTLIIRWILLSFSWSVWNDPTELHQRVSKTSCNFRAEANLNLNLILMSDSLWAVRSEIT